MQSKIISRYFVLSVVVAVTAMRFSIIPKGPRNSVVEAGSEMLEMSTRQAGGEGRQNYDPGNLAAKKPESKLVVGKAIRSEGGLVRFPVHFAAAENVGSIHAQVTISDGSWTFQRFELAPGLRLKPSVKVRKRNQKQPGEKQASPTVLELNFSGGNRAIQNGLIGYLQILVPGPETRILEPPVARILSTSPPVTEQLSTAPLESPRPLPPEPAANPAVSCFFFTH